MSHNRGMLIALLAVLGVDLVTIVCLIAILLSRRAWVSRQPGAFKGIPADGRHAATPRASLEPDPTA
jgi:hypothetical protein